MAQTPKQLQYNTLKPAGFATKYQQTRFTPAAALQSYQMNDIIRFQIQTQGYWDPYNAFMKITVQYNDTQQKGVALQLDNSAQSLIDQLLITNNSQEIERIEQYDVISAFLHDVNQTEDIKQTKLHEGINAGNRNNFGKPAFATTGQKHPYLVNGVSVFPQNAQASYPGYNLDCQNVTFYPVDKNSGITPNGISNTTFVLDNLGKNGNGPVYTQTNMYHPNKKRWILPRMNSLVNQNDIDVAQGYYSMSTKKAKYMNKYIGLLAGQEPFCDSKLVGSSITTYGPNGQLYTGDQRNEMKSQRRIWGLYGDLVTDTHDKEKAVERKWDYEIGRCELELIMENYWQDLQGVNSYAIDQSFLDEPATFFNSTEADYLLPKYCGYQRSYCAALSSGFECFLSTNLPQTCLYNGKIQNLPATYATKTFTIPLMSALFGVLLPRDSYRYIPMKYFQNLLFEFKLNPYAFFTSGNIPNNPGVGSFVTAETMSQRNWLVTRMEIFADIYYFDAVIEAQVDALANGPGIFLHTASWFLGPQYPLANTQQLIGNWQINMGFESLKMIVMLCLDTAYTSYPYCRKNFRISHNVTSFQLKFGTEYYPPQPVVGHAGNPMGPVNNSEFYMMLQKAFGKLNDIWGDIAINPINFAITERPYDPSIQTAFLDNLTATVKTSGTVSIGTFSGTVKTESIDTYTLGAGSMNTQRGMPWFHENRCIGKCLYAMNLEGFPSDDKIISGMDTTKTRPFEIIVNCDTANGTSRPSNLMFFMYADIFYVVKSGGQIQIFGK